MPPLPMCCVSNNSQLDPFERQIYHGPTAIKNRVYGETTWLLDAFLVKLCLPAQQTEV